MVWAAFHGAVKHSDPSFVIWETLSSYVAHYLDGFRGWWVGRQAKAQLEDNVCRSKEPTRQRVHKMWIQFQGRIDDYGSRKPIKLNIHSSNKSDRFPGTRPSAKLPQLFKVYTRREQSPEGCSLFRKAGCKMAWIRGQRLPLRVHRVRPQKEWGSNWFCRSGLASPTPVSP